MPPSFLTSKSRCRELRASLRESLSTEKNPGIRGSVKRSGHRLPSQLGAGAQKRKTKEPQARKWRRGGHSITSQGQHIRTGDDADLPSEQNGKRRCRGFSARIAKPKKRFARSAPTSNFQGMQRKGKPSRRCTLGEKIRLRKRTDSTDVPKRMRDKGVRLNSR